MLKMNIVIRGTTIKVLPEERAKRFFYIKNQKANQYIRGGM